jgi:competence protein ComEC
MVRFRAHALANRLTATGYVRNASGARELAPPTGLQAWRADMADRIDVAIDDPISRFIRALALGDTRGLGDVDWATLPRHRPDASHRDFRLPCRARRRPLRASRFRSQWRVVPAVARFMPRPIAMALAAIAGAVLYTAVAGFALPTVRTTLMIAVVAAVRCGRRAHSSFDALSLAVIAMVLVDPLSLLGAGFWLSVCGVDLVALVPAEWRRERAPQLRLAQAVATMGCCR